MMARRKKAVILLSGGIDSSTSLAIARAEGFGLFALTFDYRQRHRRELESARMVAENLGVEKHLVISFDMTEIGGSALTSDIEVPKDTGKTGRRIITAGKIYGALIQGAARSEDIPVTYVPARNTIFLSFALAWAEILEAADIFIGANAVDYSGYPDCRPEYLKAFEDMANLATKASVEGRLRYRIRAPLIHMTKMDIIRKGVELGLDYSLTWSCYDPQPAPERVRGSKLKAQGMKRRPGTGSPKPATGFVPCGRCDSCLFRAKGFREAGIRDPLL